MVKAAPPTSAPRAAPETVDDTTRDAWIALALCAASFVLYATTACRTVYVGDAPEFALAAAVFGVPPPPGYPLHTMLAGLFVHVLPFGGMALRANLFSAVCAAAAVGLAYGVARRLGAGRVAAAAAAV